MKPATRTLRFAPGESYDVPPCTVLLSGVVEGGHLEVEWKHASPRVRDGWIDVSFRVVGPDPALLPQLDALLDKAENAGLWVEEVQVDCLKTEQLARELARDLRALSADPVARAPRSAQELADEIRAGTVHYRGVRVIEPAFMPRGPLRLVLTVQP